MNFNQKRRLRTYAGETERRRRTWAPYTCLAQGACSLLRCPSASCEHFHWYSRQLRHQHCWRRKAGRARESRCGGHSLRSSDNTRRCSHKIINKSKSMDEQHCCAHCMLWNRREIIWQSSTKYKNKKQCYSLSGGSRYRGQLLAHHVAQLIARHTAHLGARHSRVWYRDASLVVHGGVAAVADVVSG